MLVIQFVKSSNGLLGVEYPLSTYCRTTKLGIFHSLTEHSIAQFYGAACCFAAMSKWDGVGPDSQLNGGQQFYIDEAKQFCKKYNLIFELGSNANTAKEFNDTIDTLCNYIVK